MEYRKEYYKAFLIQGKLREAVQYLSRFEEKKSLVKRYQEVFEEKQEVVRVENTTIHEIDCIYQDYYRQVFWDEKSELITLKTLCQGLYQYLTHHGNDSQWNESLRLSNEEQVLKLEKEEQWKESLKQEEEHFIELLKQKIEKYELEIQRIVEKEGYHFLGDTTCAWYGPYIWKDTTEVIYHVELPKQSKEMTVHMMTGFVARSWLDFISFGTIGTAGWAKEDGQIFCVKKSYEGEMDLPSFQITYLKHEAQHSVDKSQYPELDSTQLEYRAKLVELIYYPDSRAFYHILYEADDSNRNNSHSYASYLIIRKLSQMLLGREYEKKEAEWKPYEDKIAEAAKELFNQEPEQIYQI